MSRSKRDITQQTGVAVELCAGLGGIGIGLRALGFHIARAYDSCDKAVAVYNHNFGDVAARCNLLSAEGRELVTADRRQIGEIDLVAAGPPCKGFSQIRNGYHDGRNGHNRVLNALRESATWSAPTPQPGQWDWWNQFTMQGTQRRWMQRISQRAHETRPAAIRALILYPLNALVEDQLARLRIALDTRKLAHGFRPTGAAISSTLAATQAEHLYPELTSAGCVTSFAASTKISEQSQEIPH